MIKNGRLVAVVLENMYEFLKDKDGMLLGEDKDSGQQVGKCMAQADFTIINNLDFWIIEKNRERLNNKIEDIYREILKRVG